jgi:predicted lipoprotein
MKAPALAFTLSLFMPAAAHAAMPASDVIGQAIDGFIRPAYGDLAERTALRNRSRPCASRRRRPRSTPRAPDSGWPRKAGRRSS